MHSNRRARWTRSKHFLLGVLGQCLQWQVSWHSPLTVWLTSSTTLLRCLRKLLILPPPPSLESKNRFSSSVLQLSIAVPQTMYKLNSENSYPLTRPYNSVGQEFLRGSAAWFFSSIWLRWWSLGDSLGESSVGRWALLRDPLTCSVLCGDSCKAGFHWAVVNGVSLCGGLSSIVVLREANFAYPYSYVSPAHTVQKVKSNSLSLNMGY